jgi:hypothetical protein
MAEDIDKLQSLTRKELVESYNRVAPSTNVGLDFLREEIWRRDVDEQTKRMLAFTRHMRNMTIAITVLTVINVAVFLYSVFC